MSRAPIAIGVDVGGTKIEAVALDGAGVVHARERIPTPRGDYEGSIEAIATLVERVESACGSRVDRGAVGVGTPGSACPRTGLHRNANSTWLNGRPFIADLAARLGRPVRSANDANCFALSEALLGAARGAGVVFGVILGTGVGGGVVIDGVARNGRNGIAGEWGHSPQPFVDRSELEASVCYCGVSGCREQFLSGPALEREYAAETGEARSLAAIADRAGRGIDRAADALLERLVDRLARSLADVVNLLDPDCIVLGGGVSNIAMLYEQLPARVAALAFADAITTPIRRAELGDSSGVFGAALLVR